MTLTLPPTDTKTLIRAEILDSIAKLKNAIWQRRPVLGDVMRRHGGDTLYEYARDFLDVNPSPLLDSRKPELIATAAEIISERLGHAVGTGVARQLAKLPFVSTTDHHTLIQHPFFINANIISALPYAAYNDPDLRYLVVLSFASVSANNPSGWPRGVLFHAALDAASPALRLPLYPDRFKMSVAYALRAVTAEDVQRALEELKSGYDGATRSVSDGMAAAIREFFLDPAALAAPDFASQVTKINFRLWPRLFRGPRGGNSDPAPDLVYLEIETLVSQLLQRYHFNRPASLLYKLLFNADYQQLALRHFDNLPGAWSREAGSGTYLFWALDNKQHRMKLFYQSGRLVTADGGFSVSLTPADIERALKTRKIFPSMLLCYLTVALYYGMKCLGGFSQVHDLTVIKEAWGQLLSETNELAEREALQPVQTKELGGDGMVLAYLFPESGEMFPATGFDLLLVNEDTSFGRYQTLSQQVTMEEIMNPMLPEIYTVLYSFPDRNESLAAITPEQIAEATGLATKIKQALGKSSISLLARAAAPAAALAQPQPVQFLAR